MQKQSMTPAELGTTPTDHEIDIDHELTRGFAARLIRTKAKQLVGKAGFTRSDVPDLEQEMKVRIWTRFSQFDAEKAHWNAFVTTVVERHVATILEAARRSKRDGATVSLSELVEDDDHELVELADIIGPEDRESLTGRFVDTDENLADLRMEVADFLESLPGDLRRLCELLKTHSVAGAARRLKIPRTTASSMVTHLRQRCIEAGFEDFLPKPSSVRDETR